MPLLLFALVWLSCSWFGSWELNPNNSTRLFAAISLVNDGDATIDEFAPLTIDKARFGDHVYLDKAPGMTLMAMPAVALANGLTAERTAPRTRDVYDPALGHFMKIRLRLAAILSSALLTALAAVALWSLAGAITGNATAGMVAALAYALGSPAWGWSTTIFGHASVAALFTIAAWAIWWGTRDKGATGGGQRWLAALAGAALGWAVVVEFQAALAGTAIGLWALWRIRALPIPARLPLILAALAGGLAAGLPLIAYNMAVFGVPLKFGYSGVVGFDGMQQGFFGLTYPKLPVLFELVFGLRRGLLWVAPVLVLAPLGLVRLCRDPPTRGVGAMASAAILIVLLVNAAYVYWDGGYSTGPRHSVPALPLLALGVAPLWASLVRLRARIALLIVFGLSIAINLAIAATEIAVPDTVAFPLWRPILADDVALGYFRDLPSQFWGWSPWSGMALYLLLAGCVSGALLAAMRTARRAAMAD
ncbi:hypothetical protein [Sphingomonas sp. 28-63-12]|uniref:hypothetical protein n=1 Tax=Sphingomonas sp. 28-63-12 TaxID=1970434 RepID=UPI0035A940FE